MSSSQSETPFPTLSQSDCSTDAQTVDHSQTRDCLHSQSAETSHVEPNIQISVMDEASYEPVEYFDENEELSIDSDTDFREDRLRFNSLEEERRDQTFQIGTEDDTKCDINQSQALLQSHDHDSQSETSEQSRDSRNTLV